MSTSDDPLAVRKDRVWKYLESLPGHRFATFPEIFVETSVDLQKDDELRTSLLKLASSGEKVRYDETTHSFKYSPKYASVVDQKSLIAAINKENGIRASDLDDAYPGVRRDVERVVVEGKAIAIKDGQRVDFFLFPRVNRFLVELSGKKNGPAVSGSRRLEWSDRIVDEVRRGDLIVFDSQSYRVSSEPKDKHNPTTKNQDDEFWCVSRNRYPFSTSSLEKRKDEKLAIDDEVFLLDFPANVIPLNKALHEDVDPSAVTAFREGCANDVRALWRTACASTRFRYDEPQRIDAELLKRKLITPELLKAYNKVDAKAEDHKASKKRLAARAKNKKRRRHTSIKRLTNQHMYQE